MATNLGHDINKDTARAFEYASCYWVQIFYNQLYTKALDSYERDGKMSLTDKYVDVVSYFVNQVKVKPEMLKQIMTGIYKYFREHNQVHPSVQTQARFYDYYLSLFLPESILPKTTSNDKSRLFNIIMNNLLDRIRVCFTKSDALHRLIDDHRNSEHPTFFIEQVYTMYVIERDSMYDQFIENTVKDSEWVETVSQLRQTIGKYHKKIREMTEENMQLAGRLKYVQDEYEHAIEQYGQLYRQFRSELKRDPGLPVPGPLDMDHMQRRVMLPAGDSDDSDSSSSGSGSDDSSDDSSDSGRRSRSSRNTRRTHSTRKSGHSKRSGHSRRSRHSHRSHHSSRSHGGHSAPMVPDFGATINHDIENIANMVARGDTH